MANERIVVPGSERQKTDGERIGAPDPQEAASVTVRVRRRMPLDADAFTAQPPSARQYLSRDDYTETYGADPADLAHVERFAREHGLEVGESSAARRSVILTGPYSAIEKAFGAKVERYRKDGVEYNARTGTLTVPRSLDGIVVGVFGLDGRPQARSQIRRTVRAQAASTSYTPVELSEIYAFPSGDGAGQTIALIELGGGYQQSDLTTYFSGLGLTTPDVTSVSVDGTSNVPGGDPNGADAEVELDIEVAGAVAPGAKIVAYFAPNTDQGFLDAITTAIHDTTNKPTIISISWGGPESTWTQQALTNLDDAFTTAGTLGITVFVAAGDNGSTDGATDGAQHVDFPASSPHVVACGGTKLEASGTAISSEVVWNESTGGATGGGISAVFPVPSYQQGIALPPSANAGAKTGRGVPDVCADADPETGYQIVTDGSATVVGGTSAVAPLWAGLIARINATAKQPVGFINTLLYGAPASFHDITSGTNGAYSAGPGWDACTGLGSPIGTSIATTLDA